MKSFCLLFIIALSLFGPNANAGPGVNNGGGGWLCKESSTDRQVWIQTNDLFLPVYYGHRLRKFPGQDAWAIYADRLRFIRKRVPELNTVLERHPLDLKRSIHWTDQPLERVGDFLVQEPPLPKTCPNGLISYVQLANYTSEGVLYIDRTLWNSKAFPEIQKAALLVHEHIYKAFRDEFDDETSMRTTSIVGDLFRRMNEDDAILGINRRVREFESLKRDQLRGN